MRWCCGASSVAPAGSSTLTAKQRARKQKEAELIAAQLAKPSYWDEVGPFKPNASALKAALADTVLVDAAWLAQLADAGDILPRCQDLPEGARVTLEEMEQWRGYSSTLGVLVISYQWWAPSALDPLQWLRLFSPVASAHCSRSTAALGATGSTPTTRTRTGCSCARSQRC